MKSKDEILGLIAELKLDYDFILENSSKNTQMTERIRITQDADEFDYAALGYTIHNLYNSFESYFLRVVKFFENNLDAGGWHKSLIERMMLDIPGVRMALLDRSFALKVEELMRFRHVFRNMYKAPLNSDKVLFANSYAEGLAGEFKAFHDKYVSFLEDLATELS